MSERSHAAFWAAAGAAAAGGFVALVLAAPRGDGRDLLIIVDWKTVVRPGRPEEHPFVIYADERAWVEVHVEAPGSGDGVDVAVAREAGPVAGLSAERMLGRKVLAATVPGDVYSLKVANRGPGPAAVRITVVRDYGK